MARPMCEKTANVGGLNGYALTSIVNGPKTKAVVFLTGESGKSGVR